MKKCILIIIMLSGFCTTIMAQKPVVYIAPFAYAGADIRHLLPEFRAAVTAGISASHRVSVVDGQSLSIEGNVLEAAINTNADFILKCELMNHTATDVANIAKAVSDAVNKKTSTLYDKIVYTVNLIRVSDAVSVLNRKYENTGSANTYSEKAVENATNNALSWVSYQMQWFVEAAFPVTAKIVEIGELKKNKLKQVYINVGSNSPIRPKLYFNVYKEKVVAGEAVRDNIGQLHLVEIKGENISLCNVNKGANEIKDALEQGVELFVSSIVK